MEQSPYKEKVFDEDALQFCLSVLDFVEAHPQNLKMLRRSVLDGFVFSRSLLELSRYIGSLKGLLQDDDVQSREQFLNLCCNVGERSVEFILDFLNTSQIIFNKKEVSKETYIATSQTLVATGSKSFLSYLTTLRHLLENSSFHAWDEFFVMVKRLHDQSTEVLGGVLGAVRHASEYYTEVESHSGVLRMLAEEPQLATAFAYGQLDSKKWLIDEAQKCWGKHWGTVFVLAGWTGTLPRMMYDQKMTTTKIRSFDIDGQACLAAEYLNQKEVQSDWHFKTSKQDITELHYPTTYRVQRKDGSLCELHDQPDVVINTSCEHIKDIDSWWSQIPRGTKVILQTNNGFHIPDHVRCFSSLKAFEEAMNLSTVHYRGQKDLPEFCRYMLIGLK